MLSPPPHCKEVHTLILRTYGYVIQLPYIAKGTLQK